MLRYHKFFSFLFFSFFFVDTVKSGISYVYVRGVESNARTHSFDESQLSTCELSAFSSRHRNNSWPFDARTQCAVSFFPYITYRLSSQQTYPCGLRKRERERTEPRSSGFKPMYIGKQGFCHFMICVSFWIVLFLNLHIYTWKERYT